MLTLTMASQSKILFTDIDDTLVTRKKELTRENIEAINEAIGLGHKIVICTGRPITALQDFLEKLDMQKDGSYIITYNGGVIYDIFNKKVLLRNTLTKEKAQLLYDEAKKDNLYIQGYSVEDNLLIETYDDNADYYVRRLHIPYTVLDNYRENLPDKVTKMMLVDINKPERLEKFRLEHLDWLNDWNIFYSSPYFLECVSKETSKGNACVKLAEILDIPYENTYAIGDSENDLSMLESVCNPIAVNNATDQCKSIAKYITENDCDHSAVAEAIRNYILSTTHPLKGMGL